MLDLNGATLAYIGDAIYELEIRNHFILAGYKKVDNLHKEVVKYTSANGQLIAINKIYDDLTDNEVLFFKKGRNHSSLRRARNTDLATYQKATGLESLFGYLYLENKQERISELIKKITRD